MPGISKGMFNRLKKKGYAVKKAKPLKTKVARITRQVNRMRKEESFTVIKNNNIQVPTIIGIAPTATVGASNMVVLSICGNATGNAVFPLNNTRDSSIVTSQYLELRYILDQDNGKTAQTEGLGTVQMRVMLVRIKGISGGSIANVGNAFPTLQSILAPSSAGNYTANDFLNQRADRALAIVDQNIDVLFDRIHSFKLPSLTTVTAVGEPFSYVTSATVVKRRIKCRHKVRYSGTTAGEGNVIDGQMYLIAFTNSGEAADAHKCAIEASATWHYETA